MKEDLRSRRSTRWVPYFASKSLIADNTCYWLVTSLLLSWSHCVTTLSSMPWPTSTSPPQLQLHPFHPTEHNPSHPISVWQAKWHKTNDTPSPVCYDTTRGAWISLEIVKPVRCRRVDFILLHLLFFVYSVLLCIPMIRASGRNPVKWNGEQMWYQRGCPELGRPCKLIAGTCQLRGKQGKAQ